MCAAPTLVAEECELYTQAVLSRLAGIDLGSSVSRVTLDASRFESTVHSTAGT